MKNVTITVDENTLAWARVRAAERGMSLSRFVGQMIADQRMQKDDQTAVLDAWFEHPGWHSGGGPMPKREELYDRSLLRRHQHSDLQPGSRRSGKVSRGSGLDRSTAKGKRPRSQRAKRS